MTGSSGSLLFGTRVHTCFGSLLLDLFEVRHLGLMTNESFFELSGAIKQLSRSVVDLALHVELVALNL